MPSSIIWPKHSDLLRLREPMISSVDINLEKIYIIFKVNDDDINKDSSLDVKIILNNNNEIAFIDKGGNNQRWPDNFFADLELNIKYSSIRPSDILNSTIFMHFNTNGNDTFKFDFEVEFYFSNGELWHVQFNDNLLFEDFRDDKWLIF